MTDLTKPSDFTFEKKKKLASRIKKIHNVSHLKNIRDIIKTCNPEVQVIKSGNGILLLFNSLSDNTYKQLEKYISDIHVLVKA
jgi:hypothetical protein